MGYEWVRQVLAALVGIEPHEVLQALSAQQRRPIPAMAFGFAVLTIWARTSEGRPLIVVVRKRPGDGFDWLILGARDMAPEELADFEKWEATR